MAMIVSASGNHSVCLTIIYKTMHKETPCAIFGERKNKERNGETSLRTGKYSGN